MLLKRVQHHVIVARKVKHLPIVLNIVNRSSGNNFNSLPDPFERPKLNVKHEENYNFTFLKTELRSLFP